MIVVLCGALTSIGRDLLNGLLQVIGDLATPALRLQDVDEPMAPDVRDGVQSRQLVGSARVVAHGLDAFSAQYLEQADAGALLLDQECVNRVPRLDNAPRAMERPNLRRLLVSAIANL